MQPGHAGNTSIAGNGGNPVDGTNGWRLRGSNCVNCDASNPIYPRMVLGIYAYHAEMQGFYGSAWPWTGKGDLGLAELGKWMCIEGEVKVNTPGMRDGIMRAWVNGRLALEKTNVL